MTPIDPQQQQQEEQEQPERDMDVEQLLANNRAWAENAVMHDPEFFSRLAHVQSPEYLWIGCADSRVPSSTILGMQPGEVFVHRNIGNVFGHADLNALSVLQYAVEYLKVKHIIVCGHYGCGGIAAAYNDQYLGVIDHWLGAIKDVSHQHQDELNLLPKGTPRLDRLVELNVMAGVTRISTTAIVQQAWARGQDLKIHGFVYGVHNGILRDLHVPISQPEQVHPAYRLLCRPCTPTET